jgi:predicted dinucleotide-binding enzyme
MKIGVLGTGTVGRALGTALVALDHEVRLGSRSANNPQAIEWAAVNSRTDGTGTFGEVATWAELVVNATNGGASVAMLSEISDQVGDSIVVDVSNPLDFSRGFPPTLSVVNDDSLGEQIQRALPRARVVKALNTLNADLMLRPQALPEPTDLFIAGDDSAAKELVRGLLTSAGWLPENIHDLGGIEASRGPEMWLPLWLRLMGSTGSAGFNIHVVRATSDVD